MDIIHMVELIYLYIFIHGGISPVSADYIDLKSNDKNFSMH